MFLHKLDNFRKYAFSVGDVCGTEGDYKIRGVWMWRGTEIPNEMKEHDNFPYMTIRKLDINKEEDKQLVNDYWTKKLIKLKEDLVLMQSVLLRYLN